jgi:hypothetical protein
MALRDGLLSSREPFEVSHKVEQNTRDGNRSDMTEELKAPDEWAPLAGAGWLEALHRRYPDAQDVIVSIHAIDSGYEVRETVDSGTPEQKETLAGVRESLAHARALMIKTCRDWDSWVVRRPTFGCSG